ncbi:MAG: heavy-metal-associated domain-containing protein [Chloroflexi bacterium]|nr:heavy-metal-associated domain-containing protein [Chloroflexota bacterium]
MSPVKLALSVLGTPPVRSLVISTGKTLLADLLGQEERSRQVAHACPRCGWQAEGHTKTTQHTAEALLPRVRLAVPGLRGHAERAADVEAALARLDGVARAQASALTGRVLVVYDPAVVDRAAICRALEACPAIPSVSAEAAVVSAGR